MMFPVKICAIDDWKEFDIFPGRKAMKTFNKIAYLEVEPYASKTSFSILISVQTICICHNT